MPLQGPQGKDESMLPNVNLTPGLSSERNVLAFSGLCVPTFGLIVKQMKASLSLHVT